MFDCRVVFATALLVSCVSVPIAAQVPVAQRGKRPGANAGKTLRPSPTLLPSSPSSAAPAGQGAAPATSQPPADQSRADPQGSAALVTPQAAVTSQADPPTAPTASLTAGLGVPPFAGGDEGARFDYARTLARNLDSASVSLVNLYRGTSGQPIAGATGPATLSGRERERWSRCRDLYWDFTTFAIAAQSVRDGLSPASPLFRAAAALDTALDEVEALAECDNIGSMISAPDRWTPWTEQYSNAARHFYADWYGQMREAHEKTRAFVVALNGALPAGRSAVPIPPGLPRTPPYAGAVVH